MFKMGWCFDAYELISFKLGMITDMTKLYIFVPVFVTLAFIQGHRITSLLELKQSFCCIVLYSSPNFPSGLPRKWYKLYN